MKKRFNGLLVSAVVFGLALGLLGIVLSSQAAPAAKSQNWHSQAPAPVHATNIKVVKKILLPEEMGQVKGKPPSPPGKKKESGAATGVLGEPLANGAKKYAIVIGIGDYPGTDYDLYESDGDSLHMYKALTTLYGYDPANVYLFKDMGGTTGDFYGETVASTTIPIGKKVYGKPTRDAIFDAIMDIKDKVAADATNGLTDEVTFFFSGHGTSGNADDGDDESTDEAIIVHDNDSVGDTCIASEPADPDGNDCLDFIWDGELRSWFSDFATSRIAFVFDSCLAGGMNDVAADGRVISMATDETHSAYVYTKTGEDVDGDGTNDGESVFTRLFAHKGMLDGLADGNNQLGAVDGNVAVEESFDYAKDNIPPHLKRRQKPVISDNFTNDLLL